jgi:competence protein ComEC
VEIKQERTAFLRVLPLLWLSILFLLGIALASFVTAALWLWLLLAIVVAAIQLVLSRRLSWLTKFLLFAVCVMLLGAARYQVAQPHFTPEDLAYYNDAERVEIRGLIIKPAVTQDSYTELIIHAEQISFADGESRPTHGLLLARVDLGVDWHYGDQIQLRGELQTPSADEDFSYRDYLARQGIYSLVPFAAAEKLASGQGNIFWALVYDLRQRSVDVIHRLYPDPEAALLAGILVGDESGLSNTLKTAFNDTSTRHIIAISGFNISIIAGLLLAVFSRWLGARRGIRLAILGIIFYTLFVGAEASVVRAAIMGTLALVARQVGRQQFGLNTLAFSAALMNLVNPLILWDVGFQLSFAATLGLILYADSIKTRTMGWLASRISEDWLGRLKGPLTDYVFLTLAAQVTTLPLLLYYFQRFSLLSLPANLLILPAQPALMVLGGVSVMIGLILFPLGQLLAFFAWPLTAYTIRVVQVFAGLSWASKDISSFSLTFVVLFYLVLLFISVPALRGRLALIRLRPIVPLAALAALSFWTWSGVLAAPDGKLQVTLLDVGGEAILIRTPTGRSLLINGGPSGTRLSEELGRELPILDRQLDWLLVAGQRPEQISGVLSDLDRISFGRLAWAGSATSQNSSALLDATKQLSVITAQLQAGQRFDLDSGAYLDVLAVGDRGATLLISYGNFRALLPFGLDFDQIEELDASRAVSPISLLLLADSGYPPLNPPDWIAKLDPALIWLPGGDLPATELLDALNGRTLLQASQLGWLRILTDGQQVWVETGR